MLQLNYIRENKEEVIERLLVKNFDASSLIEEIIQLDSIRRSTQNELDSLLSHSNSLAKQIGDLFKSGKNAEANELKTKNTALKETTKNLNNKLTSTEKELNELILRLPNLPHASVPKGRNAEGNQIVYSKEIKINKDNSPHWELASKYNIIDFESGNKITGAGFPLYKGKGARLQRALINFFLDNAVKAGYEEIQPPILVNHDSAYGTGQLPDKEGQMYYMSLDDLYLIPTAEVPLTNIYRDVILKAEELPIKLTAYTPCFRREAGSYGKDVRGLNRLHQFDKIEIVQIEHPDNSYKTLEEMKDYVCSLLELLELPYRVVRLCGGDMSFASAMTYDLEVYASAQNKWLEVSSVSNFETFQANRLKLRFRDGKKPILAHTLNGSALALPRILAALLENNQITAGITIPPALRPYTGFEIVN